MTEFFFNFKDLTNIKNPNKAMLNLTSFAISDDYIKKLFPKRYNFYMKFIDGFSSPSNLYKYLYTTKESKEYYDELKNKLGKISNSLSKLSDKNKKKLLGILHNSLDSKKKYDKFLNVIDNIVGDKKISGGADEEDKKDNEIKESNEIKEGNEGNEGNESNEIKEGNESNEGNESKKDNYVSPDNYLNNDIKPLQVQGNKNNTSSSSSMTEVDNDYMKNYYVKKSFKPMETFLNDVKKIAPVLSLEPPKTIDDLVKRADGNKDNNSSNIKTSDISDKIDDLQQLYKNYLKNPLYSPERLEVNIYDRLTFIGITYLIRFITLQFIYWCLNSNIINNFTKAFIYYTLIYILFFIFIASIVNVIYFFPVLQLFSNISAITVFPNYLYYFYVYTNGYMSLIIHLFIILILLFIPFILVMDKKDDIINGNDNNISYDYKKKNDIYISISNFSLIVWVLTSIISLKF